MAHAWVPLGAAAMVAWVCASASAERGGFVISQDLGQNAFGLPPGGGIYEGPVSINPRVGMDYRGVSFDGGFDAYDNAGFLLDGAAPRGAAAVTVHRRADALITHNIFRWIDTYTNETEEPATLSVEFFSTLGSFGDAVIKAEEPLRYVSFADGIDDGMTPTKPAIAMLHGNNRWALDNIVFDDAAGLPGDVSRRFTLILPPGQSLSLMFADFLAFSPDEAGFGVPGDVTHALQRSAGLLLDPSDLFADLPRGIADTLVNWTVPGPASACLIAAGLVCSARRRR